MAARICCASPLALAASRALEASSTWRSRSLSSTWARLLRSLPLRLKASSSGLRNASQSFCSCLRSSGTPWASACQRCCSDFTASMRSVGASPSATASSIIAWRRARLAFWAVCNGASAAVMACFHSGCSSANIFSPTWPPSRQRSPNWRRLRDMPFQSVEAACSAAQALTSSISCTRWALLLAASLRTRSSQASTTLCAALQASSKRFHSAWLAAAP